LVARTATHAMTGAVLPYLKCLLELGLTKALQDCPGVKRGIYVYEGRVEKGYMR